MNLQRKVYETKNEKVIDFLIGFFGWFIINTLLGILQIGILAGLSATFEGTANGEQIIGMIGLVISCIPLILNIGVIIYFAFTRYWIALGALLAFAFSLLLVVLLFIFFLVACFILIFSIGAAY